MRNQYTTYRTCRAFPAARAETHKNDMNILQDGISRKHKWLKDK